MGFLGIGGLEFLLIFGVAMFFLGPKRMAQGVKTARKYYTELRRYRQELTSLVNEAIDADELKKDLERTKREVWDEGAKPQIEGVRAELAIDQRDVTIPELDITRPVPEDRLSSRPKPVDRGDGKVEGEWVPSITLVEEQQPDTPEQSEQPEPSATDDSEVTSARQ